MNKNIARSALIIILIISSFFGFKLLDLKFNYVFEDFFPVDDPELAFYQDYANKFENDNDYLLIGIRHNEGIFDGTFLQAIDRLTKNLESNPMVNTISSITNIKQPIISPAGVFYIPLTHPDQPNKLAADSVRLYKQKELRSHLISKDGKSTLVIIRHIPLEDNKGKANTFINDLISHLEIYQFDNYYVAGKTYAQGIFVEKLKSELLLFFSASIILVVLFLAIAYRNWWGILIPLTIVCCASIWILGFMALVGKSLDILMVLLPTIMFVVGMSDVIHLMTKYIENLRHGHKKGKAIKKALKEVGVATFLTSLTTAVGFLTLMTAAIKPIQEFGMYTALGVFIAFIVTFTVLPACMFLLPRPSVSYRHEHRTTWVGFLSKSLLSVIRHRKRLVIGSILICLISAIGLSRIEINTYLIEDLPQDDPLKKSFTFFDQQFGGSRPFEVAVEVGSDKASVFSPEVAWEIEKINEYLINVHKVGGLVSSNTIIKSLFQSVNGGHPDFYRLPSSKKEWNTIQKPLSRLIKKKEFDGTLTADHQKVGRISGWIADIGSNISLQMNEGFRQFVKEIKQNNVADFTLTGTSNLIDKNNLYLAQNMFKGLAIAFCVVALIAGFLFKSWRMVLISLVPNVIPLLMVAAIMGYFGISLKLSTSIVFTIAFGIAVDDTLHFISKFKLELNKGKTQIYALKRTYLSTGKAIIVTSSVLSGGFLILLLSSFGGTFYTGLLISLTLVFALVIDLTLLPALILLFFNHNHKNPSNVIKTI
ncbi:MAG TPA: efflux RND transporter permease subunit [Fulvivirga sp.]|nr:efflux RND transporter permease subunit [Fulvivirga sp.]